MADQVRKMAIIRSIEKLQLPNTLISALDDAIQAKDVVNAVDELMRFAEKWN